MKNLAIKPSIAAFFITEPPRLSTTEGRQFSKFSCLQKILYHTTVNIFFPSEMVNKGFAPLVITDDVSENLINKMNFMKI